MRRVFNVLVKFKVVVIIVIWNNIIVILLLVKFLFLIIMERCLFRFIDLKMFRMDIGFVVVISVLKIKVFCKERCKKK